MNKHIQRKLGLFIFLTFSLFLCNAYSNAQETVDLSLKRTFGMAFGKNIQGTFTVVGSGSEGIVNLSLLFNNEEIEFSVSNSLSYTFKTKEYGSGNLNITLLGYDIEGIQYSTTKLVTILSATASLIIIIGIILLVTGAVVWNYVPRIKKYFQTKKHKNRKNNSDGEEK
jgi:hypothetical protein